MKTYDGLRNEHPTWLQTTIRNILAQKDSWNIARMETLYESPCVKCNRQMGEHTFNAMTKSLYALNKITPARERR